MENASRRLRFTTGQRGALILREMNASPKTADKTDSSSEPTLIHRKAALLVPPGAAKNNSGDSESN